MSSLPQATGVAAGPMTDGPTIDGHQAHRPNDSLRTLAIGAVGIVFGDIGTSPLYSLKESFVGQHPLAVDPLHIFGVISLIFWTMTLVVTIKYVFIIMRAENHGEGGSLALLALISDALRDARWQRWIVLLGILATALFYGDAIITPAISVLSAVEGLEIVQSGLSSLVLPVSIAILVFLFTIQSHGTHRVGRLFGPIMIVYFALLAVMGIISIAARPDILWALNPIWALRFFLVDPSLAFLALGAIVLAVTGAEALYADMGHFGRRAIGIAWLYLAFPCLIINYLGQGALLLRDPRAIENPFFLLAPHWARLPLVLLATMATVIASQAVISGAYSVTQQAVQLGMLPRLRILHTSATAIGQIYVPFVNWALMALVILLALGFGSSSNLAAAYGIAVTGTMFITSCMLGILTFKVWRWNPVVAGAVTGLFLVVDGGYLASNLTKIPDGGWFPLLIAGIAFTILTTWAAGRRLVRIKTSEHAMPAEIFAQSCVKGSLRRVSGTAVFLSANPTGVPSALLHNVKHNKIIHQRVVILTVQIAQVPRVDEEDRAAVRVIGPDFYRVILHYGFMEEIDIPATLARVGDCGGAFPPMDTSYYLGRQTLIAAGRPGMALWRERLFAWMVRNAESAMSFFKLPPNRVIELGSQVEI